MEARYMTDLEWRICHAVNIYLYRNGSDGEAPMLVHIPPTKKKNMKSILNVIQDRVKFPVGFASYIYKMDGKRIRHPCELEMYNNYVVASNYDKHFKCAQYGRKRSPLLVLNRESKHIRVLRQQNQNFYEWSFKKNTNGEERPQNMYPTSSTSYNDNRRQPNMSRGQIGNNQGGLGEGQKGGFPPEEYEEKQNNGPKQMFDPPRNGYYEYPVNTCLVNFNQGAQQALKATQNFSTVLKTQENKDDYSKHWSKRQSDGNDHHKRHGQAKLRISKSDVLNGNVVNDRDYNDNYISDHSKLSITTSSESILETDCLGAKYQEMLKDFKRKLKKQALLEARQSSLSSIKLSCSRHHLRSRSKKLSKMSTKHRSRVVNHDDEIIVLPPPPLEFRDGIIPRRGSGTFYSYGPLH